MKHVVLLTIDTLRKDLLGCYGGQGNLSPFLDSLQNKSIRFNRAQAVGPYTQASFPGILTSSYYLDQPDHGKGKILSGERTLVSEVLRRQGIATAAVHSNAYLCNVFGWNRGWDSFYDAMDVDVTDKVPYLKGDGVNKKVEEWLSGHIAGGEARPFFLWVHYMDIHEPYVPPRKYVDLVDPSISLGEQEMFALFRDVLLKRDVSDPETVQLLKKLYQAHVRECDDYVREFFAVLEKYGVLEDCVVFVTADHGDEFGEHGGLSHDGKAYSELVDIPLFIYDPARKAGETCETLVGNVDLPPTILKQFGLAPEPKFQGVPLPPFGGREKGEGCFGEAIGKKGRPKDSDAPVYYYREEERRISYYEETDEWRLYDLAADPEERHNLIETAAFAAEMKNKLKPRIERKKGA